MIEILFIAALALLVFASIDRWQHRSVLVVSLASGESIRGRRALGVDFALTDAELLPEGNEPISLPGRVRIPRQNISLIQALPAVA